MNADVGLDGGRSETRVVGTNASGVVFRLSGGVAENFQLFSGCVQNIYSGGVARNTGSCPRQPVCPQTGGARTALYTLAKADCSLRRRRRALSALRGNIDVRSAAPMRLRGIRDKRGGEWFRLSGSVAENFIVYSGGVHSVLAGGSSLNVLQHSGGNIDVNIGGGDGAGTLVSGTNAAWSAFRLSGGVAENFFVYSGGVHNVLSGGSSFNVIQKWGGSVNADVGGAADGTVISGTNANGSAFTLSGGVAENFIVFFNGRFDVKDGGIAKNTILSAGALSEVSGGKLIGGLVMGGADLIVFSGGVISGVRTGYPDISETGDDFPAAAIEVRSGGVAADTYIDRFGEMTVLDEDVARNNEAASGGLLLLDELGAAYVTRFPAAVFCR